MASSPVLFPEIVSTGAPQEPTRGITPRTEAEVLKADGRASSVKLAAAARRKAMNQLAREAQLFALRLVRNPKYRAQLERDLETRLVDPAIEKMLWAYACGQPPKVQQLNINSNGESGAAGSNVYVIKRVIVKGNR